MAQVAGGMVVLNNGQRVTPQVGGWYDGQQYAANGSLAAPGQFNSAVSGQSGQAPVQNANDAAYLAGRGDTGAAGAVVGQQPNNGGGGGMTGGSFGGMSAPPAFDLVGVTNAAYNSPDIIAANKAFDDTNAQVAVRQAALAKAQSNINDNPFYSEATRVGKSASLSAKANADIGVLQNQATLAQQKVASLKADAAVKVNAAMGQYNINRQQYQDTLQQFNKILDAGGLTGASPQDMANYSVATGIPYSALQSIQQKEQNDQTKTQIIPSTDANGNVTITAVDKTTGKIISQSSAGDVSQGKFKTGAGGGGGSTKTGSSAQSTKVTQQNVISEIYGTFSKIAGAEGFVSKEDWAKMKTAALSTAGFTSSQFDSEFGKFENKAGAKVGYNYN